METKINPMPGYVFVQVLEDKKHDSGIVLPDSIEEEAKSEGIVIASFEGSILKHGTHVVFNKYTTTKVVLNGVDYLVLKESDVYAVIKSK